MVDRMKQRSGGGVAPPSSGGGYPSSGNPLDDIYAQVMGILSSGNMDEASIVRLGQLLTLQQAYGQQQQFDLASQQNQYQQDRLGYDQDQLSFLRDELGLRGDQLAFELEKFKYESGDAFEFYKQERGMQHEAQMKGYESQMQQSADDVLRSANYLQQQRLGTEAAGYNRDIARYNAMQAMGLAPNPRQEYVGSAARLMGY